MAAILIVTQMLSCTWARTREFLLDEVSKSKEIDGWSFKPVLMAYWHKTKKGIPPGQENVFPFRMRAMHPRPKEADSIYGVDVDTVFMTCVETDQKHIWYKYSSSYTGSDESRLLNWFVFISLTSGAAIFIPREVDTVLLEFDAIFYKGICKEYPLEGVDSLMVDTVAVDTMAPHTYKKRIKLRLIRNEGKTLVPSFI